MFLRSSKTFCKPWFNIYKCQSTVRSIHLSTRERKEEEEVCRYSDEELKKILKCRKDVQLEECLLDVSSVDPRLETPKVAIVGAGMAGLSAAEWLIHCGITDITVIEATDRPGGRIHSCWLDGSVIELGAPWIDGGSPANPVFNLACREGLIVKEDNKDGGEAANSSIHTTSKGEDISPLVNNTAYHSFKLIEDQAAELYGKTEMDFGSLEDFFGERLQQELKVFPEDYRCDAARAMSGMTNELRTKLAADLTEVSASMYGSATELPGGLVKVPSGMIGVLAPLIRDLPPCVIKYCKPVEKIIWSGPEGETLEEKGKKKISRRVKVICCDDDVISADYVIVTFSLGVLKKKAGQIFSPGLPEDKKEAIDKLGYGFVDHVFFKYDDPFWPCGEGTVKLAWSNDELADRRLDWARSLGAWEENDGLLMVRVAGKRETECVEKMSELKMLEEMCRLTRTFTGDPLLPFPTKALCSKWTSNPYFLGAKSFIKVGSSVEDQRTLGEPVPRECGIDVPALLFAGEATCPGHHATLHGARLSGIREAQRIVSLTEKLRGLPTSQKQLACASS